MKSKLVHRVVAAATAVAASVCVAETRNCITTGTDFASCALVWDAIVSDDDRLTNPGRAYEAGIFDGFVLGVAVAEMHKTWCPQQPFTPNQLSAVTSKFLRSNPEQWGERPNVLVTRALSGAFPCARKKSGE